MTADEIIAKLKADIKMQNVAEQDRREIKDAVLSIEGAIENHITPVRTVAILLALIIESVRVEHGHLEAFTDVTDHYLKELAAVIALRKQLKD
jgi:hypothetical protein